MGIAYVARGNNIYDGSAVVGATAIENGCFVDKTFAEGVATLALGTEYFVCQEDGAPAELAVDSKDLTVAPGEYAKIKVLLPGEAFVTSVVADGATFTVGADVSVVGGKLAAGATGAHPSRVIEVMTIDGVTCYMCEVRTAVAPAVEGD